MSEEVQLAIYDLSMGMARGLSAQFLGPQHAVDIIPHTAILAYGKEWYFGQGIERCDPGVFRATWGIFPIEIQSLGRTTRTESQFEEWCRARATDGEFGPTSYDFFHRNCNNFSEEAARRGLGLGRGVPPWILEMPRKFLSSPMGMAVRPMLEQMQIANNAPTNVPSSSGAGLGAASMIAPSPPAPAPAAAANPWANIPAATPTPAAQPPSPPKQNSADKGIEKQTALLSTDTAIVKMSIDRLNLEHHNQRHLFSKLADEKFSWSLEDIDAVHRWLRDIITSDYGNYQKGSFALTLMRLAVLRGPSLVEQSMSAKCVAKMMRGGVMNPTTRSMAWCVLSNAMGSSKPPDWDFHNGKDYCDLNRAIDEALRDCDPCKDGASSQGQASLRQSASAFLYNSSRFLTVGGEGTDVDGRAELSEGAMSIILGCLEHLREEADATTAERLYMAVGQLLKSPKFGKTATDLVKELGLLDEEMGKAKNERVKGLAEEVASLLA